MSTIWSPTLSQLLSEIALAISAGRREQAGRRAVSHAACSCDNQDYITEHARAEARPPRADKDRLLAARKGHPQREGNGVQLVTAKVCFLYNLIHPQNKLPNMAALKTEKNTGRKKSKTKFYQQHVPHVIEAFHSPKHKQQGGATGKGCPHSPSDCPQTGTGCRA